MGKRMGLRKFKRNANQKESIKVDSMDEMFEHFMLFKKSEGLARRTIEEYYINYDYFQRYSGRDLKRDEMNTEFFMSWISHMLEEMELAPNTVNIRVRTMRAFVRFCYEEKGWVNEPIHRRFKPIKAPIDNVEAFTEEEVKLLFGSTDDLNYTGFRTKVIMFFLLDSMVRVFELVNIKRKNVDLKNRTITLEAEGTKLRKARKVPISLKTAKLLDEYMTETAEFESEYLFLTYEGERLAEATVRDNLTVQGKIAGISKRCSPHVFRHTGSLFYIKNGGDPFSLQKILDHSHMNMVRRYIQMTNTDVQMQHNIHSPVNYLFKTN